MVIAVEQLQGFGLRVAACIYESQLDILIIASWSLLLSSCEFLAFLLPTRSAASACGFAVLMQSTGQRPVAVPGADCPLALPVSLSSLAQPQALNV